LGIPEATLHTWVKTKSANNKKNINNINSKFEFNNLLEENRKLHKELARLKQEKEILKKAAAYFAQELS
jgi:transposase